MHRTLVILAALFVLSAAWALLSMRGARVCGKNCGCRAARRAAGEKGPPSD